MYTDSSSSYLHTDMYKLYMYTEQVLDLLVYSWCTRFICIDTIISFILIQNMWLFHLFTDRRLMFRDEGGKEVKQFETCDLKHLCTLCRYWLRDEWKNRKLYDKMFKGRMVDRHVKHYIDVIPDAWILCFLHIYLCLLSMCVLVSSPFSGPFFDFST